MYLITSFTTPRTWMSLDHASTCRCIQALCGSPATITHRHTIATGTKAKRKTGAESRGIPHFVQPPSSWDSAITSPAPASRPMIAQ